jgi:hypothetical protein
VLRMSRWPPRARCRTCCKASRVDGSPFPTLYALRACRPVRAPRRRQLEGGKPCSPKALLAAAHHRGVQIGIAAATEENHPLDGEAADLDSRAAGQQERADKLLNDLQSLNEGLVFVSGKLSTTRATMLPSRMLPHVWGEENLQTFIDATAQHEPDLARCAEFKREVLAATKEALLAAQKPGPAAKISPLRLLPPRISKRCRTEHSHLTVTELSDKTTGKVEPVLLEDKSYASGPRPQHEKFVEARVCDCVGYVPNRQDKSYSFVFRFPGEAANDADPISLQKLLPSGPSGWYKRHQGGTNFSSPS